MAMLGDVLAAARRSAGAGGLDRWLVTDHPRLYQAVSEAAAREGASVGGFARLAVGDFSQHANEGDWSSLLARIRDCQDPGATCLLTMLEWRLGASGVANEPSGVS